LYLCVTRKLVRIIPSSTHFFRVIWYDLSLYYEDNILLFFLGSGMNM
jgi:hypothetical protein